MAEAKNQKHFVLVHGANHGGWCWYKLKPSLEAAGHRVTALDLVASGINMKAIQDVDTLYEYTEPLLEILASLPDNEKVILVGHSLGGQNLALAADKFPEKISAAVFLTAFMPDTAHKPLNDEAAMILLRSSVIIEGAAIPSPSSPISQVPAKPESLTMKCQWQKGKLIGRGTFGSVYVARNRETGALCAMKEVEMFPNDPKSAECIKQLEQEIKVLSNLKHPNIVQYYGSEIVEDKLYIYLEYVPPGSINKYVREHCGALTESIIRNFTRHILFGLAYLHSKRTVHRDIKGANLLVDVSGVVKLADFGMAKHLTGQAAELSPKGSPYWIAPELIPQRYYNSDLALAVDIWSLGCTIIEMYTGKPPWSELEGVAAMFKVTKDTPSIPESLSAEGKDFLRCCFQRNPANRPLASKLLEHRFLKNSQQQPDV